MRTKEELAEFAYHKWMRGYGHNTYIDYAHSDGQEKLGYEKAATAIYNLAIKDMKERILKMRQKFIEQLEIIIQGAEDIELAVLDEMWALAEFNLETVETI